MLDIWTRELRNMVPVRDVNFGIIIQESHVGFLFIFFNNQNSDANSICDVGTHHLKLGMEQLQRTFRKYRHRRKHIWRLWSSKARVAKKGKSICHRRTAECS